MITLCKYSKQLFTYCLQITSSFRLIVVLDSLRSKETYQIVSKNLYEWLVWLAKQNSSHTPNVLQIQANVSVLFLFIYSLGIKFLSGRFHVRKISMTVEYLFSTLSGSFSQTPLSTQDISRWVMFGTYLKPISHVHEAN
jgi:hypothetical protein